MKFIIALYILCVCTEQALAQNKRAEPTSAKQATTKEPDIYKVVEQMPEYPGGEQALYKYLSESVNYPDTATKSGIEGLVKVKFVVDDYGSIVDVKTTNTPIGFGLEEEAIRVIKMMPPWKPGKNDGKPVKVYFQIPIRFVLPKEETK